MYTRNGSLTFDANGQLVNRDGAIIQGWMADANHVINTNGPTTSLVVPSGQLIPPVPTSTIVIGGNLPTSPPLSGGTAVLDSTINVFDGQGTATPVTFEFTYTPGVGGAAGSWAAQAKDSTGAAIGGSQALVFDGSGNLTSPTNYAITLGSQNIAINFASTGQSLVNFGGNATVSAVSQDGSATGTLQSITVSKGGVVSGVFSNGANEVLGEIALASFTNPSGLVKAGGSLYQETSNSGQAQVGAPDTGGRGTISSGVLEGSNVDLAQARHFVPGAQEIASHGIPHKPQTQKSKFCHRNWIVPLPQEGTPCCHNQGVCDDTGANASRLFRARPQNQPITAAIGTQGHPRNQKCTRPNRSELRARAAVA